MFTRLFGQSKPINFLLVATYMAIFYVVANAHIFFGGVSGSLILEKIALLLLYILGMVILNFIAKRNDLNKINTYKVILYACFTVLFFSLLQNDAVISANIFMILALRRVLSLRTNKDTTKKIFDATFWLCLASLFQFWTILLLVVIYFGILFHSNRSWKNFTIPLTAIACVYSITTTYWLFAEERFYRFSDWFQYSNFDFTSLNSLRLLIPLSLILAMIIWVLFSYFRAIQKASISLKPSMYLIVLALFTSIVIAVFSPTKNGSELLFLFAPLSIMTAKYFERETETWFKDALLFILILLPIALPIFF